MSEQLDPEIQAMSAVSDALGGLDEEAAARVMEWAAKRFGIVSAKAPPDDSLREPSQEWEDFVDLLDAADGSGDNDRALVAGYWLQEVQGQSSFRGQEANELLKGTGYPIANITTIMSRLENSKPAQVRVASRTGTKKMSRKNYKVTAAGISVVQLMVRRESGGAE